MEALFMSNMVVRTNIFAKSAHRNMKNVGLEQRRASNRLSSGYRINSAADDAAGLAISETMRSQIRGLDQASRNAQDSQAMMLTAEGGLEEIGNVAQRIRELLVQASNDTNTQDQRAMINHEIQQLAAEIDSMKNRVEFNANRVLALGTPINTEVANGIAILDVDNLRLNAIFDMLESNGSDVRDVIAMLNPMSISTRFEDLNANQQRLIDDAMRAIEFTADNAGAGISPDVTGSAGGMIHATEDDGSTINDIDDGNWPVLRAASPTPTITEVLALLNIRLGEIDDRVSDLEDVRVAMLQNGDIVFGAIDDFRGLTSSGHYLAWFQVGANASQGVLFDFENVSRTVTAAASVMHTVATLVANPDLGSGVGSGIMITSLLREVNDAIEDVSSIRANLGAVQNRLDHTMRSLDLSSENLQESESRVRNADMAREMMAFTMSNVLQESAMAMLSQANQIPNNLLQVLQG